MPERAQTILLVEDEALIARDEQQQLEDEGYTVYLESTGEKAVEFVRNQSVPIDLILMDINLGWGMDGTEAARKILKEYNIPVLFLSAYTDRLTIQKTGNVSSYGFVVKTSGIAVLSASIRMAINLHRVLRELQSPEEAPGPEDFTDEFFPPETMDSEIAAAFSSPLLFTAVLESTADAILIVAQDGTIMGYNTLFAGMWGLPDKILVEKNESEALALVSVQLVDPDDFIKRARKANRYLEKDGLDIWPFKDGRLIESYSRPLSVGGKSVGRVWSCRDVTERSRMEAELRQTIRQKEILMKEVQHRVKNSLAVVSGLLSLELGNITEPRSRAIFADTRTRIIAISSVYDRLAYSESADRVDLHVLIGDIAESLHKNTVPDSKRIQLKTALEKIGLDTKRAVPLALILNELLTNSLKYAYPGDTEGEIRVDLRRIENRISIRVEDDGAGLPEGIDPKTTETVGLSLVRMLAEEINAYLLFERGKGTKVSIEISV